MNIIRKEDLLIDSENNIRINPEKEITYYKNGEKKSIEINGETYYTQSKSKLVKEKLGVKNYTPLTFNFDLLDLTYNYYPSVPHYYNENLNYECSKNNEANSICNLFIYGLLDKTIIDVRCGKFMKNYSKRKYESYWSSLMYSDDIDILLFNYGYNNNCWYSIKVEELFKIPFKKFKQKERGKDVLHYRNIIDFFNYYEINLKDGYKKNIDKYNKKKTEYKNQEELKKQTRRSVYNYKPYIKDIQKTYILKDKNTGYYKIGKSVNPINREKTLQSEKPTYKLIKIFKDDIESELHRKYKKHRIRGEWFNLNKVQLKYICTNYEEKKTYTDTTHT